MSTPNDQKCISCRKPGAAHVCGLCAEPVCRGCAVSLPEGSFAYEPVKSKFHEHTWYCGICFDGQIAPELEKYQAVLELARQVSILPGSYRGHLPLLKRARVGVSVEGQVDRDETILALAFLAAREGFNAVIQAEVLSKKVRNHGYQTSRWSGTGVPALIDQEKLRVQEYREEVWRRGH